MSRCTPGQDNVGCLAGVESVVELVAQWEEAYIQQVADFIWCGVVLQMPFFGRFMCPFAVAGLRLRYFVTNFSLRLGHPLTNPFLIAFNRIDSFGLPIDWWVYFTVLTRVQTEWTNATHSTRDGCAGVQANMRPACNFWAALCISSLLMAAGVMGSVHRLVVGSLVPVKIITP